MTHMEIVFNTLMALIAILIGIGIVSLPVFKEDKNG